MSSPLEYHISVRRSISASVALFSLLALPVVLVSTSHAQINGVPSSVTSTGFGGRAVNGTPPSVTSIGPRGFAPRTGVTFTTTPPAFVRQGDNGEHHHHHQRNFVGPTWFPYSYAVPIPYESDNSQGDTEADDDSDYQGGPTIFDRRGSGEESYIPPVKDIPKRQSTQTADTDPPSPEEPPAPTLLVFKSGSKLEVGNYAIVGSTLFDLTPGHARKVPLADLDLEATQKQNDDRGVIFRLPQPPTM